MTDLDRLLAEVREDHAIVVGYLERGLDLSRDYLNALTDSVAALLAYTDKVVLDEREPQTCVHCGHAGTDVTVGEDREETDRRNTPRLEPQCDDARACLRRRSERHGWATPRTQVGDTISVNAIAIPDDVLEFVDSEGDRWRRPADLAEATHDGQVYDWVTVGGWSTTEGRIGYAPLRVTKVALEAPRG